MSKGSKQRPLQISEQQMQDNWDFIFSEKINVVIWPNDAVCFEDELEEFASSMSDDYIVAKVTEKELNTVTNIYDYCIKNKRVIK